MANSFLYVTSFVYKKLTFKGIRYEQHFIDHELIIEDLFGINTLYKNC